MGETSNFYEKCSSLSKKGDEKSLRTLLQMGISGNKTARVALRKTRNKKLLKTLIDEYLDNIPSEYNAGMILNLAVKVLRKEYLYVYLMEIFHEKKDLKEIGFFKSVKDIPLDKQEQIEVKKYIIDTKDFDIRLISLIAVEEREDILYALLTKAMDDGLDARTTKIFLANKDYLQLIQPELREAIEKRVEGTSIFATYLDLKEKDNQKCIVEWLERTAESPNEKVSISSIFMLAAKYIQMEKYKEANIFLDKIPDTVIDATIMKTNVLAHQEGTDIAAFFLEGKLMQTVTNIQNYLYKLIEMEEETGNHCKAEEIAEITEHMVSLFGLWDYGKVVPYLLIAVYRKDVEKCIQLIKEVLMESKKPWKMVESPLYYRYVDTVQGKSFSGVGNNFVHALATEIENKEEYEFLKGNKELEAIFSQYLK